MKKSSFLLYLLFFATILGLPALLTWAATNQPQPVTVFPPNSATPLNCSGTITSGGTAQTLIAASANRHFFQIQNLSTDPLAFSEFTAAPAVNTNGSWTLNPATSTTAGGSYTSPLSYVPTLVVSIIGATTGDKFTCAAW